MFRFEIKSIDLAHFVLEINYRISKELACEKIQFIRAQEVYLVGWLAVLG